MSAAAEGVVTVTLDTTEISEGLASLAEFLERALQLRDRVIDLLQAPGDLAGVQFDVPAASGAGPLRAALHPTDRFRDLVAAARAGNVHLLSVEEALHATAYPAEEIP